MTAQYINYAEVVGRILAQHEEGGKEVRRLFPPSYLGEC